MGYKVTSTLLRILLVVMGCTSSYAASTEYAHFVHYSTNEGLASNKVWCLETDPKGHLWIATDFGLDRFNGKNFKHFEKKDYPNLVNEEIHNIQYIGHNRLMLSGMYGLHAVYDMEADTFGNQMPKVGLDRLTLANSIYFAPDSTRYLLTNSCGLFRFNKTSGAYERISSMYKGFTDNYICSLLIDDKGRAWVGLLGEVKVYDSKWNLLFSYKSASKGGAVTMIKPLGNGEIAALSYSDEVWIFDTRLAQPANPRIIHLPFNNALGIMQDHTGRYWIGTDGDGLWYSDDMTYPDPHFTALRPLNAQDNGISKIYAMKEDANGNIWIGTYNYGLWCYVRQKNGQFYFSAQKGFPTATCTGFLTDNANNLWVSTDGSGLFEVKGNYQQIEHHDVLCPNLVAMSKDAQGNALIGTWGRGVVKFDMTSHKAQRLSLGNIGNGSDYTNNVCPLANGETWICTGGFGLYHQKGGSWNQPVLQGGRYNTDPDIWPRKVVEGKNGTTWVLTSNTLWYINGDTKKDLLPNYTQQKSNTPLFVKDAVLLSNGDLLVATTRGLIQVQANGSAIDTLKYVPCALFSIILMDNKGDVWAASSEGIMRINLEKKNYKMITGNVNAGHRYSFFPHAGYKDANDHLYFGTTDGFYCCDANANKEGEPIRTLSFSDLYINNSKVKAYTDVLREGNIGNLKEIELDYDQSNISIEVDLVDFDEIDKAQCRYRLVGLQDEWIPLGDNNIISFSHLPKGHYTLVVEASRGNNEKKTITLNISVLPPWWSSWWFRLLFILAIAGYIGYNIVHRMNQLKRDQHMLSQKVDDRTRELKNALTEKNQLISVIAHDLKNPMFAIVSSLDSWISKNRGSINNTQIKPIEEVYNSASVLQNEMQKLLDWVQTEKISTTWAPGPVNLTSVIDDVVKLLDKQLKIKGISLTTDMGLTKCAWADSKSIEIVVRNLVSNSIKFTPRGGNISIKTIETAGQAMIEVTDNGVGMKKKVVNMLMTSGSHISTEGTNNEKGTGLGIGLCHNYIKRNNGTLHINSKPGFGTSFIIMLPLTEVEASTELTSAKNNEEQTLDIEFDSTLLEGNTLLVVDDDELLRNTLCEHLNKYSNTINAANGEEGFALAKEKQPDIIISDVSMPVMDGLEMGKAINAEATTRHIPLLFISANNEEEDRLKGLQSGAVDYIVKPFSKTELLLKLNNMLSLRQKIQQNLLDKLMAEQGQKKEETVKAEVPEDMAPDLKKFMELLEQHYTESDLQIDTIAKEMCISQSTMSRRIKSLSGKTPVELLSIYRLNKAKALLLDFKSRKEDIPIAEIAMKVGFTDPSYFTRKFKDLYGYTPSQVTE